MRRPLGTESADWHYRRGFSGSRVPWFGMSVAGALLALGLLGFNQRPKPVAAAVEEPPAIEIVDWPKAAPDPEESSSELADAPTEEGIDAPSLPDVPTSVSIENSFVQEIDYSSFRPKNEVSMANLSAIPAIVRHGGGNGRRDLKDLFNLADLDRIPQPVFQPLPKITDEMLGGYPEARATLEFIVTKTGEVIDVQVVDADTRKIGEAAATAIARWKFRPGYKGGRAVNSRMRQPMFFKPAGKPLAALAPAGERVVFGPAC
jgi:protein TonB